MVLSPLLKFIPGTGLESSTSPDIVVAIVDTGFDHFRALEEGVLWMNPAEATGANASNGVDDDGNKYVDDWAGWDWVGDDNDPFDWPAADSLTGVPVELPVTESRAISHGTAVVDLVNSTLSSLWRDRDDQGSGARVKFQNLRVGGEMGPIRPGDVSQAVEYAALSRARVVLIGLAAVDEATDVSPVLRSIDSYPDTVFVVPAGNSSTDLDATAGGLCQRQENVICVAAIEDHSGGDTELSPLSNFGRSTVDAGADGAPVRVVQPEVQSLWRLPEDANKMPVTAGALLGRVIVGPQHSPYLSCELSLVVAAGSPSLMVAFSLASDQGDVLTDVASRPTDSARGGEVAGLRFSSAFSLPRRTPATIRLADGVNMPWQTVKGADLSCAKERGHGDETPVTVRGSSVAAARATAHVVVAATGGLAGPDLRAVALRRAARVAELSPSVAGGRVFREWQAPSSAGRPSIQWIVGVGAVILLIMLLRLRSASKTG